MKIVEALDEEQVGDLLDHPEGIGHPARPEGIPDLVDLGADWPSEHVVPSEVASVVHCGPPEFNDG